jgi:Peptidase family M48
VDLFRVSLEIGLPLINMLTLGEFKAVLAHEFGHFAQRSMAVGRWVYVSQQVAVYLISKRDGVDKFLNALGSIHLALTALAWVLNLIVWSIRALIESVFQLVLMAQRALSREMELQADLVSVSVTGSDALIQALYRTAAAEETWDRTLEFANKQLAEGKAVENLLDLQSRLVGILRKLRMEPSYGQLPKSQEPTVAQRLFKAELAQPSRMWSTHPLNHEREDNAKKIYVSAPSDDRSSWLVFADANAIQCKLSSHMLRHIKESPETQASELALLALDLEYDKTFYQAQYRGIYMGRYITRSAVEADELYDASLPAQPVLTDLYPETLHALLNTWRELEKDKALLSAIQSGQARAQGGVLRYRGQEIERRQLPRLLAQLESDLAAVQNNLQLHDKMCRSHSLRAAQLLSADWESYLRSLGSVLHYAEHSLANLSDLQGMLGNTVAVTTAAGPARQKGAVRIVAAAQELHGALVAVSTQRHALHLHDTLAQRLAKGNWNDTLGDFDLAAPSLQNINEWIRVIDGWYKVFAQALDSLRQNALEHLLQAEAQVQQLSLNQGDVPQAPAAHSCPKNYISMLHGQERKRQMQLSLWARFQRADGPVAAVARLSVAASVVGAVVGLGGNLGSASLTVYNGLARPVMVKVGGKEERVPANGFVSMPIAADAKLSIEARTLSGQIIEQFSAQAQANRHQIYNVASASPMLEWTASYGNAQAAADQMRGTDRWFGTDAAFVFTDPPKSITSKSGGGSRLALSAVSNPAMALDLLSKSSTATMAQLIATHARWDEAEQPQTLAWLTLASRQSGFDAVLSERLKANPLEMLALRTEQDRPGADRAQVCARHQSMAAQRPDNADLKYLSTRCLSDSKAKDAAFDAGYRTYPKHPWFAYAAGYTLAGNKAWSEALAAWKIALPEPSLRESLSIDIARLRRLQAVDRKADLSDLLNASESLRNMVSIEAGDSQPNQGAYSAYIELARGNLAAALSKMSNVPIQRDTMLRLVAVADGAEPQWINAARDLPSSIDLPGNVALAINLEIAVKLKTNQPIDWTIYQKAFDDYGPESKASLQRFIQMLQMSSIDPVALENTLEGCLPEARGTAYWLAHVALGAKAPPHWPSQAKRLLFVGERSYIK